MPIEIASIICLLDDDLLVLDGLSRLLSSCGFQPKPFSDSEEFLTYAKTHRAPVAILDIWMPSMNGLEVQSRLGEISPLTRVIILTGKDDALVRSVALEAGAWAFFTKPFDSEAFLASIRTALGVDEPRR